MKDWKTTVCGILTIAVGVANAAIEFLQHKPVSMPALGGALTVGLGLIKAADSGK